MTKPKKKRPDAFERPDWPAMRPELRPLAKIYPYPKNPKTHPPAQVALLAELFKRHGIDQPIAVDEDGVILKGHGRLLAAGLAGLTEFPVVVHRDLPEAEKIAMRVADNQVPLLGGWDKELVRSEIGDLKTLGYDIKLLGFGDAQLVQFETTPGPPGQFPAFGENIPTDFCCPKCGFKWSGRPAQEPPAAKKKA